MKFYPILFCCCLLQQTFAQTPSPASGSGQYLTSFDSTKIYYEMKGQGQPVILLHGFTNTLENWKNKLLYQDLLDNGFRVVVLDLRGNGKSDKPTSVAGYEHDAEARDVMALADALGFQHYQVVGYSRGSIIAARLLVLDTRITAAVLGGMGESFTNPDWPRRVAFYNALSGQSDGKEFEEFLAYVDQSGLDRQMLAFQQQAQPSTSPTALAKINIPVLVIAGEEDHDNGSAEKLAKLFPKATVKRVPGVHNTAHQSPQFAREVLTFLQQSGKKQTKR